MAISWLVLPEKLSFGVKAILQHVHKDRPTIWEVNERDDLLSTTTSRQVVSSEGKVSEGKLVSFLLLVASDRSVRVAMSLLLVACKSLAMVSRTISKGHLRTKTHDIYIV